MNRVSLVPSKDSATQERSLGKALRGFIFPLTVLGVLLGWLSISVAGLIAIVVGVLVFVIGEIMVIFQNRKPLRQQ
jgi:hypothetical protein